MATPAPPPWRLEPPGLRIAVRLTPHGGRDAIDGVETLSDGRRVLACRVRAIPTEGEANAALLKLLARTLGVPASRLAIASGAKARAKTVAVSEAYAEAAALLVRILSAET